jgi:hypothetical protein
VEVEEEGSVLTTKTLSGTAKVLDGLPTPDIECSSYVRVHGMSSAKSGALQEMRMGHRHLERQVHLDCHHRIHPDQDNTRFFSSSLLHCTALLDLRTVTRLE